MSFPANALQTALYTRLSGYSALTTLLGTDDDGAVKIYDHVKQDVDAPYITIGEIAAIEADTKTNNGWLYDATIHSWDFLKAGRKSVNAIMEQIFNALHKSESNITVTGFNLVYMYCDLHSSFQEQVSEGASDHYYHGVQRFKVLIRA